ncbi:hypothetical protein SAMD00019534_087340, partial [Acytostelium subglobosum LB1]|uniref:hypothetical protein n=1 Tax=Acytostelium subglobosum LB1 TaxID=1410327 RepID=UPI000644E6F6
TTTMTTLTGRRYISRATPTLLLMLLVLVGALINVAHSQYITSDESCPFQPLPSTFDSITYLGYNQEMHIQNTYHYDYKNVYKEITFTLQQKSAFRIYVAPMVVDVDVWLYDISSSTINIIAHTVDATTGMDESLSATLNSGTYKIKLMFFGANKASKLACPTINLEYSVVPIALLSSRSQSIQCPAAGSTFPNLALDMTDLTTYRYDSDVNETGTVMNIVDTKATGSHNVTFFKKYSLVLPSGSISTDKWGIEITMGFDFLTGGSLGLLLQSSDVPAPTGTFSCIGAGNCTIGVHTTKNHATLKAVVTPGLYDLYLYDQTQEKDYTIGPSCTIFSLQVDIESAHVTETFLNCDTYSLPTTFNGPGFIDDGGYLYFSEELFLDLVSKSDNVMFTITTPSFVRAYIPEHRVDIDMKLTNGSNLVVQSLKWGGEEEITAYLYPGTYNFTVMFFGKNIDVFCDTFHLDFAITPQSDYDQLNYCKQLTNNVAPQFQGMQQSLTANGTYTLNTLSSPTYIYQFDPSASLSEVEITSVNFTITSPSYLQLTLESNFVLGDIRALLIDNADADHEDSILYRGTFTRNTQYMFYQLENGTYTLSIMTGITSKNAVLPPCATYSLKMAIKPNSVEDPCWGNPTFPSNLNTPAYLGTSTSIHLTDDYMVPAINYISSSTATTLNVTVPSLFRAFIEDAAIDVDISLYEGTKKVAWTSNFAGEESLEFPLKANVAYRLVTSFFHWPFVTVPQACYTYSAAVSITPSTENPKDKCASSLPPTNFISNASMDYAHDVGQYHFTQTNKSLTLNLPFSVPKNLKLNAMFRAILTYDFVWNDLVIALLGSDGTTISYSTLGYNRADILPMTLPPGDYFLSIYEPFANIFQGVILNNCVDFTLEYGIQLIDDTQVNQDTIICDSLLLPQTFNSIGYMSGLTDGSLSFQQNVLVDVMAGNDLIKFTLTAPSLLRVFLPAHMTVDIDFSLLFEGKTLPIARSVTTGEEIIYNQLDVGNYSLKFIYFGMNGSPLPKVEDCTAFPAFISIAKVSNLLAIPSITAKCTNDSITPPANIIGNLAFNATYQRLMQAPIQPSVLSFTTNATGQIHAYLKYNDLVDSMMMKLNYTTIVNGKSVVKTIRPLYEGGLATLNEIIPAGSYQLTIYDRYNQKNPVLGINCAQYSFGYFLNTTTPDVPTCDSTSMLPTDLFSTRGGSFAYGGPQNSDGEILFTGKKFFITPGQTYKHNRIDFMVPTVPVYMRLFADAMPLNDIDFFVYSNSSDPSSLVFSSFSGGSSESALVKLQPQTQPYTLDVNFMSINRKQPCNYFKFEWAIETADNLEEDLLCPTPLPNEVSQVPPETVNFPFGKDLEVSSSNYMFTSTRINQNLKNGVFTYRMTLEIPAPTIFFAQVTFDFLDNDFDLTLSQRNNDGTTTMLASGTNSIPSAQDTAYNFLNGIEYNLTAGVYALDISENMKINSFNISTKTCHFFGFQMVGQSLATGMAPRITSVSPPGGFNINPLQPLTLTIRFSESVLYNDTTTTLLNSILKSRAVVLTSTTKLGMQVVPNEAYLKKTDQTSLVVTFAGTLNTSAAWNLTIDASKFRTMNNILFQDENTTLSHVYKMFVCDCGGHGHCVPATSGNPVCTCDQPWTGQSCTKCMAGYHGVATTCVANTKCAPMNADCNGHGVCNSDDGFPECQCNNGYITLNTSNMCGDCDIGYTGYPKCVTSDDDRGTLCTAPLLPLSLNFTEYLAFNNKMHIQDNFYLDYQTGKHITLIEITVPSVLRIYTEPHRADVDLWLYTTNPDGTQGDMVDHSITFGHEEVMLDVLQPGTYILQFRYFLWDRSITLDCETFNMGSSRSIQSITWPQT